MSWMEVLPPIAPYFSSSNWNLAQKGSGNWTEEENKVFEDALARFDSGMPERWEKVAAMIPGKTVGDVMSHYRDLENDVNYIEAGLVSFPEYDSSSVASDWENSYDFEGLKQAYFVGRKRKTSEQERKKGVPWTQEEHRRFLVGLKNMVKVTGETYLRTQYSPGLLHKSRAMHRSTSSGLTHVAKIRGDLAYMT